MSSPLPNISKPIQSLARELRNNQSRDDLNLNSLTSLMRQSESILMTSVRTRLKQEEIVFYRKLISDLFGLLVADTVLSPNFLTLITNLIREISSLIDGKLPRYFNEPLATYSEKRLVYLIALMHELDSGTISESNVDFLSQLVVSNLVESLNVKLSAFSLLVSSGVNFSHFFYEIDEFLVSLFSATYADNTNDLKTIKKHGNSILKSFISGITSSSIGPKPRELDGSISNEKLFSPIHHIGTYSIDQTTYLGFLSSLYDYIVIRFGPKILAEENLIPNAPPVSPLNSPINGLSQPAPSAVFSVNHRFTSTSLLDPMDRALAETVVQLSIQVLGQCQREISSQILEGRKQFRHVATVAAYGNFGQTSSSSSSSSSLGTKKMISEEPLSNTNSSLSTTTTPTAIISPLKLWTREYVESVVAEILRILNVLCAKDPSIASIVFPHIKRVYERIVLRPDSPGTCTCEMVKFFLNHSHLIIFDLEPVLKFFFSQHIPRLLNCSLSQSGGGGSYNRSPILATETYLLICENSSVLTSTHWPIYSRYFPAILQLVAWYPRLVSGTPDSVLEFTQIIDDFVLKATPEILADIFHTVCDLPLIAAINELSLNISDYILPTTTTTNTVSETPDPAATSMAAIDTTDDVTNDQFANGRIFMRLLRSSQFKNITDYVNRTRTTNGSNIWISDTTNSGDMSTTRQLLSELWQGLPLTPRVSASTRLVPLIMSKLFEKLFSPKFASIIFKCILSRFGTDRIFLFKRDISDLFVTNISKIVSPQLFSEHRNQIVTAILERVFTDPKDELVINLVFLIGSIKTLSQERPLFVRTLIWILLKLTGLDAEVDGEKINFNHSDIVYIKDGRLVQPPSIRHELLDHMETHHVHVPPITDSLELACVIVMSLTKIGIQFPQYRPRILSVLSTLPSAKVPNVLIERTNECTILLKSHHINEELVVVRES